MTRTCGVEWCDRKHKANGWCSLHLQRHKRGADMNAPVSATYLGKNRLCDFPNCDQPHDAKGYCAGHRMQQKSGKELRPLNQRRMPPLCDVVPCGKESKYSRMCATHYTRKKKGKDLYAPMQRGREHRDNEKWCHGIDREGHWVPKSGFRVNKARRDGLDGSCAECKSFQNRFRRYGMTRDDYFNTLEKQGHACAMCKTDKPGGRGGWHTDHDHACCPDAHTTGSRKTCGKCVRGLLCNNCNKYLGFVENEEMFTLAISYLRSCNSNIPTTVER